MRKHYLKGFLPVLAGLVVVSGVVVSGGAAARTNHRCALRDSTHPASAECEERVVLREKEFADACDSTPLEKEGCGRWYDGSLPLQVIVLRDVHFDFAKSEVRSAAAPYLRKHLKVMQENPSTRIRIVGHTDAIGSDAYNQKLSEKRARAVKKFLVAKGIPAERIDIEGQGESQPTASNKTVNGRQENRRVEMYFEGELAGRFRKNTRVLMGQK